jgi:nicotinate-nucleotide adenylyltransferase
MNSVLLEGPDIQKHRPLLGLFGGTFDPVHYGHLRPVLQAAKQLNISEVSLIPCHIPPHKNMPQANNRHRLNMLEIVCQLHPEFRIDDRELHSATKSYTVQTLRQIHIENPNHTLCFFIGMDSLLNFNQWYKWREILQLCHIVVCQRPQNETSGKKLIPTELLPFICDNSTLLRSISSGKILIANTEPVNISSTEIRDKSKFDGNKSETMPQAIIDYIDQQQLYR